MLKPLCTYFSLLTFLCIQLLEAQNSQKISAELLPDDHSIQIQQEIIFRNNSQDTLNAIYLYDWNHAYSNKSTALATRFAEEFNKSLHLAKEEDRGKTSVNSITNGNMESLPWERIHEGDIIKLQPSSSILPNEEYRINLTYVTKLPNAQFTDYGFTPENDFNLRFWYITPALYYDGWKLYSNKNLNDLNAPNTSLEVNFTYPEAYYFISDLNQVATETKNGLKTTKITGENRGDVRLFLKKENDFTIYKNEKLELISNIESKSLNGVTKATSVERVVNFIDSTLGDYPHKKLLISEQDYKHNPLYGLNQLPNFLRPFPEEFQYELKVLKTALHIYLNNTIYLDNRTENWVKDGIETYLLMKYVNTFYKDMKLLGKLSDVWGLRSFHLAQMTFNDQYPYLYMLMARTYSDQPLTTPRDSLIKFNERIANKYKSGVGLAYLDSYLGDDYIDKKIKTFYADNISKVTHPSDFEELLKKDAPKDIDWFFETYVSTNKKIDFKIKKFEKTEDSIAVTIKNKRNTNVPITMYGIDKNDSILFKNWYSDITKTETVTVPRKDVKRLVLNYDRVIPEFNERDNWKSVNGFLSTNRKLKFQFFKDTEDPYYNQVFYVPVFRFNIYDGITPGLRLYNKTFLAKPFVYDLQPSYAFGENALVGSGSLRFRKYVNHDNMYLIDAFIAGSSFHYADGLRYSTITPSLTFRFRNDDLRSNERELLNIRFVNVIRDFSPTIDTDPDYSVLDIRYAYGNNGIIDYKSWFTDVQIASEFAKVSFNWEYRKLFQSNRQLNLRFFAGKFIYNQTNSDYFSFALDRPTDYLFDYDYLGRSEDSGIFSQQLIIAEGGFKSKLNNPFANDWMITSNASFNLWRWIELYGDVGMIRNKNEDARFVYDSGIRLNLVTDYFELYFPIYSNNGWEIAQPQYDEKIRFIITLSPRTLTGLFTRKWF
ncbi:gluzincin family metallopeptidase [Galbibacter mesophilus]|uniref:metalloprotease n=1 Tax=Galbibacter mesophilus TaxID=379069 RepID=UPI001F5C462D|nr:metalloprotease [Galbibacter mesophilus]MCM5664093.1 metalloprotease [Galbibacter mesophilus]